MDNFIKISPKDKEDIFINVAIKNNLNAAIVEKDFWVSYILNYLFTKSPWKNNLVFKGGTSLSKGYNLIKRFSEDIDLILDWRILGYSKSEIWVKRSNNQQNKFINNLKGKNINFLKNEFYPKLKEDLEKELNMPINLYVDPINPEIIRFAYPKSFSNQSILQEIILEIGPLAAWNLVDTVEIEPLVAKVYPQLFLNSKIKVKTVLPERTFWEKVTILHQESNRPMDKRLPLRYFRHYYDVYCLANSYVKNIALANTKILNDVVIFKSTFYKSNWAKYNEAIIGSLKLVPPQSRFTELKKDYIKMKDMFFEEIPSFEDIMLFLKKLEIEINTKQ